MSEMRFCPMCGSKLPPDAPSGLCPQCLLKQGLLESEPGDSASRSATVIGAGFIPPTPEELSEHFPQLEVLELIGKGGMGAVYKARQPALDRIVALKILPPEVGNDAAFAERFTREARALAKLNHHNIVGVFDFGQANGLYYFLMEYVDGANLRDLIHGESMSSKDALAIVPQICEALEFAHEEGIVHRDIKPENILVDKRGRVKIADFGLAKLLQAEPAGVTLTQAGQVMGTWYYMAPEQIERPLEVDHRADIYSLGVVFYEMLTGEVPAGRFDPPSKRAGSDVRLDEVVLRTLEREPARRYQHASQLKSEVETIAGISHIVSTRMFGREFRSKTTIFGVPLVHLAFGLDPVTGRSRTARGIIAIGEKAVGGLAIGGVSLGGIAIGGCALGIISFGGLALAILLAVGGLAIGGTAFGGGAVGVIAVGGGAVGLYSFGGGAWGLHALGSNSRDPEAMRFFMPWAGYWAYALAILGIGMPLFAGFVWMVTWIVLRVQDRSMDLSVETEPLQTGTDDDSITRQIRGPAMGLVATGLINWVGIPIAVFLISSFVPFENAPEWAVGVVAVTALAASAIMIAAGMLMIRMRSRGLCKFGSILAMIISPGNLIGLPLGIWALIVLSQREVRDAFGRDDSASEDTLPNALETGRKIVRGPADLLIIIAGAALLTAIGIALWLSFAALGWDPNARPGTPQHRLQDGLRLVAVILGVYTAIVGTAAVLMRRLRARLVVLLSVVLVGILLPAVLAVNVILERDVIREWPVGLPMWLGMPVALWSAIVLFRNDVREAFLSRQDNGGDARAGTLTRAWNDWWSNRDKWITNTAKCVLLILYILGFWGFFTFQGSGRAEEFHHTIGMPTPWFEIIKDAKGHRWHITIDSWAWLVALAAYSCYYAWYRIRLTEGGKIGPLETPRSQVILWGIVAMAAVTLSMWPLFLGQN